MATIQLRCTEGTHQLGVETMDYADANGPSQSTDAPCHHSLPIRATMSIASTMPSAPISCRCNTVPLTACDVVSSCLRLTGVTSTPHSEFDSSVGRADGYWARAIVVVVPTTSHADASAYSADGRNAVKDLVHRRRAAYPHSKARQLERQPRRGAYGGCGVCPTQRSAATRRPTAEMGTWRLLSAPGAAATDTLNVAIIRPQTIALSAGSPHSLRSPAMATPPSIGYASTSLRADLDGLS